MKLAFQAMAVIAVQVVLLFELLAQPSLPSWALVVTMAGFNTWFWPQLFRTQRKVTSFKPPYTQGAYLVVTLNTRAMPPHVTRVEVFSCSAQNLTLTGGGLTHLDLYEVHAATYQRAKDDLLRGSVNIWPWLRPFLADQLQEISGDEDHGK